MARRGILALLIHQAEVAARAQARAQREAVREHNASVRRAEQASRAAAIALAHLTRTSEADRRRLQKQSQEAHIAAMEAAVEERNLALAETNAEIESLLSATLNVDDYVDLETFRVVAEHPPFDRPDLEVPTPPPAPIQEPPKPSFVPPDPPTGFLAGLFGKKDHAAAIAQARETHEEALARWRKEVEQLPAHRQEVLDVHARAETERLAALEHARARYASECTAREAEASESNKHLDDLIVNLSYGTPEAVQEYISIVLAQSVYPEHFQISHSFEFEPSSAELRLHVRMPGPDRLSEIKAYKYTRASDEITETQLPKKVCRDRYASAVHQVALRSIHEVFESDRRGLIRTVSLEVGTDTVDPATGQATYIPFVVAAAEREAFLRFDLSAVIPAMTLGRLGAAVSRNPYGLVAVETSGIRRA